MSRSHFFPTTFLEIAVHKNDVNYSTPNMALQKFNLESLFDFILVFVLHVQLGYFNHYYYILTYLKKERK